MMWRQKFCVPSSRLDEMMSWVQREVTGWALGGVGACKVCEGADNGVRVRFGVSTQHGFRRRERTVEF